MSFIFSKLFGCCKKKEEKIQSGNSSIIQPVSNSVNNPPHLPAIEGQKKTFNPAFTYEVHSIFPKESLQFRENMPEILERKLFRYSCPLCYRYFNHMIQCSKCKNYVCRLCADDIGNRALEILIMARCPFCDVSPFILNDVDENEPVKKYTDTPYSSAMSGFRFSGKPFIQPREFGINQNNPLSEKDVNNENVMMGTISNIGKINPLIENNKEKEDNKKAESVGDINDLKNKDINSNDKENVQIGNNIGYDNEQEYRVIRDNHNSDGIGNN